MCVFVCMCICVCVCVCVYVCVCMCLSVSVSVIITKSEVVVKRNYDKIISHVSDFISPIRLQNIPGTLAGLHARVSGWGRTSGSEYNFLIISQFDFKNFTYQNDCFKGEETHGHLKILRSLRISSIIL